MQNNKQEKVLSNLIDELEKIRKDKNMSHEKLAELSKLHRSTISLILNKKRTPTILSCLRIANALGVKLSKILGKFE